MSVYVWRIAFCMWQEFEFEANPQTVRSIKANRVRVIVALKFWSVCLPHFWAGNTFRADS